MMGAMRASPDDHLRTISALRAARDWEGLLQLRDDTHNDPPSDTWSVAGLCEYHLALSAPAAWAAVVVNDNTGDQTIGPLHEIVAQQHAWAEIGPLLSVNVRANVAHERIIRGEDLRDAVDVNPSVLNLPLALQPWEAGYQLAEYRPDEASFPQPPSPALSPVTRLPRPGEAIGDPHVVDAFKDLVRPWFAESNGKVNIVTCEGGHLNAIASLGATRARLAEVSFAEAMAWMVWAGASGGARGRRRGNAIGRYFAWHSVAAIAGVSEEWPIDPLEMGEIGEGLHWYLWDTDDHQHAWKLRLAVYDDVEELGLAVAATDQLQ